MPLKPEELRRAAALARIDLTDVEVTTLTAQLGDVLERVERLEGGDDAPPDGAAPPAGRGDGAVRGDRPGADALALGLEAIAPGWTDGFFTVPRLPSHQEGAPAREEAP
ncbi:MAG TPA: hypothetical protein VMM12_13120 [Longimicrobiales bacterium]|nr:hypothetical protein [Longimicrobiales bacterium]